MRAYRPRISRTIVTVCVGLVAAGLVGIATVSAAPPTLTKGPIPDEAWKPGAAQLDMSLVPDFVPALGRTGDVVGYIPKEALDSPIRLVGRPTRPDMPVYADDLSTLVGHMVADKGFVALGVDPDSVPNIPVVQAPAP